LYTYSVSILNSSDDAEDLVQTRKGRCVLGI
jgi:hypothetical protein